MSEKRFVCPQCEENFEVMGQCHNCKTPLLSAFAFANLQANRKARELVGFCVSIKASGYRGYGCPCGICLGEAKKTYAEELAKFGLQDYDEIRLNLPAIDDLKRREHG